MCQFVQTIDIFQISFFVNIYHLWNGFMIYLMKYVVGLICTECKPLCPNKLSKLWTKFSMAVAFNLCLCWTTLIVILFEKTQKTYLHLISFLDSINAKVIQIRHHGGHGHVYLDSLYHGCFLPAAISLLPKTQNCGWRMRRVYREHFPRHRLHGKLLVSDPGMHHGACVTHVSWCMSGKCSRHSWRMHNPHIWCEAHDQQLRYWRGPPGKFRCKIPTGTERV